MPARRQPLQASVYEDCYDELRTTLQTAEVHSAIGHVPHQIMTEHRVLTMPAATASKADLHRLMHCDPAIATALSVPRLPSACAGAQRLEPPLCFDRFILHPTERWLECDGQPVRISSRAFDILHALLERPGEIVPNRTLIARAWPGISVEEANLRVHIAALRRLLASSTGSKRCITNVPSRGYTITIPVRKHMQRVPAAQRETSRPPLAFGAGERVFGRDQDLERLQDLVQSQGVTTIVGPGGIGKTALAQRLMHVLRDRFDGIYFVDLSGASAAEDLLALLGDSLGQPWRSEPDDWVQELLRDRNTLIVFDTCEHIIEPVAALTTWLRSAAPDGHMLLTTRAATRSPVEHVHVLSPLLGASDLPCLGSSMPPQVQLFVAAARAGGFRVELNEDDWPLIASICRRLDGNPLAIEIVGSRIATHGIHGASALIDNPEWLLTQTSRGLQPRHRTISAMLDWSYSILARQDREVLGCLSELKGSFTVAEAERTVIGREISACELQLALSQLLEQSLVTGCLIDGKMTYRLPNLVKLFARSRSGGLNPVSRAGDETMGPAQDSRQAC